MSSPIMPSIITEINTDISSIKNDIAGLYDNYESTNGNITVQNISAGGGNTAVVDFTGSVITFHGLQYDVLDTSAALNTISIWFDPDVGTNIYLMRIVLAANEQYRDAFMFPKPIRHAGSGDIMVSATGNVNARFIVFGKAV